MSTEDAISLREGLVDHKDSTFKLSNIPSNKGHDHTRQIMMDIQLNTLLPPASFEVNESNEILEGYVSDSSSLENEDRITEVICMNSPIRLSDFDHDINTKESNPFVEPEQNYELLNTTKFKFTLDSNVEGENLRDQEFFTTDFPAHRENIGCPPTECNHASSEEETQQSCFPITIGKTNIIVKSNNEIEISDYSSSCEENESITCPEEVYSGQRLKGDSSHSNIEISHVSTKENDPIVINLEHDSIKLNDLDSINHQVLLNQLQEKNQRNKQEVLTNEHHLPIEQDRINVRLEEFDNTKVINLDVYKAFFEKLSDWEEKNKDTNEKIISSIKEKHLPPNGSGLYSVDTIMTPVTSKENLIFSDNESDIFFDSKRFYKIDTNVTITVPPNLNTKESISPKHLSIDDCLKKLPPKDVGLKPSFSYEASLISLSTILDTSTSIETSNSPITDIASHVQDSVNLAQTKELIKPIYIFISICWFITLIFCTIIVENYREYYLKLNSSTFPPF